MPEAPIHRVGIGTDLHPLVEGGPLKLGGVEVPFTHHLHGHSDADVVLHALTDALLGAAGLPDIGELFPDTDPQHKGADSRGLLTAALEKVRASGYQPVNIDLVIHAERPKLSSHKPQIRSSIAKLVNIPAQSVSVKAKTNEGLDAVGRGEAIACTCVVGLTAKSD
jgi:2-C-methyl-D-erythritol 2,4-cyclodiphosphate synthase